MVVCQTEEERTEIFSWNRTTGYLGSVNPPRHSAIVNLLYLGYMHWLHRPKAGKGTSYDQPSSVVGFSNDSFSNYFSKNTVSIFYECRVTKTATLFRSGKTWFAKWRFTSSLLNHFSRQSDCRMNLLSSHYSWTHAWNLGYGIVIRCSMVS